MRCMLNSMPLSHPFSSPALEPAGIRLPWQFRVRPLLFVTIGSIVAILLVVGSLFCARRLTGDLTANLTPATMLLFALVTAATLTFSRIAWRRSFPLETPEDLSITDQMLGWASSAALTMLAVGSCYPANRTTDLLIWLPILVADQFWRQNFFDAGEPWIPHEDEDQNLLISPTLATATTPQLRDPKLSNVVQQIFRMQDEHQHEVIYGTLRADFVAGQRTAVVHVGFCPPLAYLPEIEAEALPGSQAKIKVVQALAHGTRIDIRLPSTAPTDCQLWIDLAARPVGTVTEINDQASMPGPSHQNLDE